MCWRRRDAVEVTKAATRGFPLGRAAERPHRQPAQGTQCLRPSFGEVVLHILPAVDGQVLEPVLQHNPGAVALLDEGDRNSVGGRGRPGGEATNGQAPRRLVHGHRALDVIGESAVIVMLLEAAACARLEHQPHG